MDFRFPAVAGSILAGDACVGPGSADLLLLRLLVMIEAAVEVMRDRDDLLLAPVELAVFLPSPNLRDQGAPILGELLVAPVDLGRVAGDAMRRVKKLALRHARRGRRLNRGRSRHLRQRLRGEDCTGESECPNR